MKYCLSHSHVYVHPYKGVFAPELRQASKWARTAAHVHGTMAVMSFNGKTYSVEEIWNSEQA